MNITLSKVRQSTLGYIYTYLANGSQPVDSELFWSIAQEKEYENLRKAHAKAVLHTCRDAADSARLLADRLESTKNRMHGDMTTAALREEIERYAGQSIAFDAALRSLLYSLGDKMRDSSAPLAQRTSDVLRQAAVVESMGRELTLRFADFPCYRQQLEGLAAAVNRRARMMLACLVLQSPETLSDNKEYSGLARQAQDIQELRPAVEKLATAVIARIPLMESRLEGLLNNYSVDRLDYVDKAILYISLYELEENGLEVPIVVSEATALANEFSGSKSAPFIHGVIAAAAASK